MRVKDNAITPDLITGMWSGYVSTKKTWCDLPSVSAQKATADLVATLAQEREDIAAVIRSHSGVILAGAEFSSEQHCRMGLFELHDGTLAISTHGVYKHRNHDDVWLHYWGGEWTKCTCKHALWLVSDEKSIGTYAAYMRVDDNAITPLYSPLSSSFSSSSSSSCIL